MAATGVLLSTIDASIVNIALPTISEVFHTTVQMTAWVTISYLMVITAFLLIFGRLSDILGQKLIFTNGLAVFTIGSALCAISGGIGQLIFFRLIQGIGAAMIVSNTSAIVTNAFPPEQRGMGMGVIGAVVSVGLMSGPPLGGFLIHYLGWHYIFLVNVPIGVAAVLFTLKILPEHKADAGARIFHPFDSVLWILGVLIFISAFRPGGDIGTILIQGSIMIALAVTLMIYFIFRQKKTNSPLFNPSFFKNEIFLFASISGFFSYMTMIALTFMLPYLLENSMNMTPFHTGNILVAIPATTAIFAPLSGYLSDKFGQRPIASLGILISTTAIIMMFFFHKDTSTSRIILNLVVFGIGLGMFGSPNNSALMGSVDYRDRGSAGGVLATVRNLGMVTGLGVISIIYNLGLPKTTNATALNYVKAFNGALPYVLAFSLLALVFSALRRSV